MINPEIRQAILDAFQASELRVLSVDTSTGQVEPHVVVDVLRHETPHKATVRVTLSDGREVVTTLDHSLFRHEDDSPKPVTVGDLRVGDNISTVSQNEVCGMSVTALEQLPPEMFTYDLSVPGPENFVITNGILAHNSYSIGGVSLDLDKSSKYEAAQQAAQENFNNQLEKAKATVNILKGVQQPKFGTGIRSAFVS